VFDAHHRAFVFFGGVPTRGIYDNMKTAVDAVQTICRRPPAWWTASCRTPRVRPMVSSSQTGRKFTFRHIWRAT